MTFFRALNRPVCAGQLIKKPNINLYVFQNEPIIEARDTIKKIFL